MHSVKLDHVRCFDGFQILVRDDGVVQFCRSDGRDERFVRLRHAHARWFEKSLRAVQTLWAQLVVSETPEQFAHQNVDSNIRAARAHISRENLYSITPTLFRDEVLQRDDRVWILLHGVHFDVPIGAFGRTQ